MKNKFTVLLVLILVVVLAASGCTRQKISEKIVENIVEKVAENESGENVDIDINEDGFSISSDEGNMRISGGEDLSWPEDIPDSIPEFKGKIYSSMASDDGFMVSINEVNLDEFGAYTGTLESKGFNNESTFESQGTFMKQYVKDEIAISVSYSEEAKTLTIIAQWE